MIPLTDSQLEQFDSIGLYYICKRIHLSFIGKPGESLTQVQLLERYNYLQHRMMKWKMPSQQGAKWDRLMYLMVQCALDEAFVQLDNPRSIEPEAPLSPENLARTSLAMRLNHPTTRSRRVSAKKPVPKNKTQ
jgi:hypothetical protein